MLVTVQNALLSLQGLLGVVMLGESGIKFAGFESQVEGFRDFGYPQWFRIAVAGTELLGGAGLLVGIVSGAPVTVVAGLTVLVILTGALASHARVGDPVTAMAPAAVLLVLTLVVMAYNSALPI